MRSLTINCFKRILVFTCFGLVQTASADDPLTQSNKALVRDFYTTVLINRQVDAAPRFLRAHQTRSASCLMVFAKTTWLSFMCGRRGRVVTGSTNKRSDLICFECKTGRLPSTGDADV